MPLVMGHEFCGVVEEVGKESHSFKKGDRVLVPFSQGDGDLRILPQLASRTSAPIR